MTDSLAPIVAQHYNKIEEKGLEERKQSRIFYMRNFNNWIKSMLIKEFTEKIRDEEKKYVLDIGSGKGGDLLKWKKGNINYLVCADDVDFGTLNKFDQTPSTVAKTYTVSTVGQNDIAATSVEQCQQRYVEMKERHKRQRERGQCFDAEFITADCTKERLKDMYKDSNIEFNIVSCQFAFHYCFESIAQARTMLQNISECLKPGGYFIGSVPDSYDIMRRLEDATGCSFGNDVYTVTFPSKERPKLFGAKYDFHLEGVVDCPEFLVYFPALLKLAEEVDLELLYCKRFEDYYEEKRKVQEGQFLLTKMQALETYPPTHDNQKLMGCDDDYFAAQQKIKALLSEKEQEPIYVGTLSQAEWEVFCMYCVFAFVKKGKEEK